MEIRPLQKGSKSKRLLEKPSSSSKSKESIKWTFSKAKRFIPIRKEHSPNFCDLPSTLNDRTCSFGLGKRWTPMNEKGKDSPSPGTYESPPLFGINPKGPTFKAKDHRRAFLRQALPGPGSYDPYSPLGKEGPKFTFRQKFINKVRISTPPPNSYHPNYRLVEKDTCGKISFGIADRPAIYGKLDILPGPGSYNIPSSFNSGNISSRTSSPLTSKRAKTPIC